MDGIGKWYPLNFFLNARLVDKVINFSIKKVDPSESITASHLYGIQNRIHAAAFEQAKLRIEH